MSFFLVQFTPTFMLNTNFQNLSNYKNTKSLNIKVKAQEMKKNRTFHNNVSSFFPHPPWGNSANCGELFLWWPQMNHTFHYSHLCSSSPR